MTILTDHKPKPLLSSEPAVQLKEDKCVGKNFSLVLTLLENKSKEKQILLIL